MHPGQRAACSKLSLTRFFCLTNATLSLTLARGTLMTHTFKALLNDEAGFIISAELVLVMTVGALSMVVGLTNDALRVMVHRDELNDVSHAIGTVSQSYNVTGLDKPGHAWTAGFGFNDNTDECDCKAITLVDIAGKNDPSKGPAE